MSGHGRIPEAVSRAASRNITLPGVDCAAISAVGTNAVAQIANITATKNNPAATDFESFRTQLGCLRNSIRSLKEQAIGIKQTIESALRQAKETVREAARAVVRNATNRTR